MKKKVAVFLVFFLVATALAISDEAIKAREDIDSAEKDMEELKEKNLSTARYLDTLEAARQLYDAQLALEKSGGLADYGAVLEKAKELKGMHGMAFKVLDELRALEMTLNQSSGEVGPVRELFGQAKAEFADERYEEALKLIEAVYGKISELEALQTRVKAFYEATSRSVTSFLRENWRALLAGAAILGLAVFLGHNRLACLLLEKRLRGLELRRESVKALMAKTQREFFDRGEISESTYRIKMEKYGELVRDINRQIPLLKEELTIRTRKKEGPSKK